MNKKAISPLIATVLLIVFTVSVAVTVMTWGKQLIMEKTETVEEQTMVDIACGLDVSIDVADVGGERQLCYNSDSQLEITVENGAEMELTGLQIVIISEDSVVSQLIEENFSKADLKKIFVAYTDPTPIHEVRLMPQILDSKFCLDAQIIEVLIPGCD